MRALVVIAMIGVLAAPAAAKRTSEDELAAGVGVTSPAAGTTLAPEVGDGTVLAMRGAWWRGDAAFEIGLLRALSSAVVDPGPVITGDVQRLQPTLGLRLRHRIGRLAPYARLSAGVDWVFVHRHAPSAETTGDRVGILLDPGVGLGARFGAVVVGVELDAPLALHDGDLGWDVVGLVTVGLVIDR